MLLYPDYRDQKEELPYCRDRISEFQQLADRGDKFIVLSIKNACDLRCLQCGKAKKNNEQNSDHHRQRPSQIVLVQKSVVGNQRRKNDAKIFLEKKHIHRGGYRIFSRGGGGEFSKKCSKILSSRLFFK